MTSKASGIFLLCLLAQHAFSVPMSEFFALGQGTFTTLGDTKQVECVSDFNNFLVCDLDYNIICVSFCLTAL